ncbi:MAG: hypothetical protein IH946_11575 [Bacteroidetes bacterium]|nr:hypothetical protein [Bacteroidota bacterium]
MYCTKLKLTASLFFCLFSYSISAQIFFERVDTVPVVQGTDTINLAWGGGLNNPQFSEIDLNNDGILDLFIFEYG